MARATPRQAAGPKGRAAILAELAANKFSIFLAVEHPALAGLPMRERQKILDELERDWFRKREAERRVMLLERLRSWEVSQWRNIFAEMPELEPTLPADQRRRWREWLASRKEQT